MRNALKQLSVTEESTVDDLPATHIVQEERTVAHGGVIVEQAVETAVKAIVEVVPPCAVIRPRHGNHLYTRTAETIDAKSSCTSFCVSDEKRNDDFSPSPRKNTTICY